MTRNAYYPPPAFSFSVMVAGTGTALAVAGGVDGGFQEISGIEAKIETETVIEGGQNRYALQLPGVTKSPNLVLRRGYVTKPSFLSEWAAQTVGSTFNQPILTQTLLVMLMSTGKIPLVAWNFDRAWPVRWVTGPFESQKNEVLTEVLEFSYTTVSRIPLTDAAAMVPAVGLLIDL